MTSVGRPRARTWRSPRVVATRRDVPSWAKPVALAVTALAACADLHGRLPDASTPDAAVALDAARADAAPDDAGLSPAGFLDAYERALCAWSLRCTEEAQHVWWACHPDLDSAYTIHARAALEAGAARLDEHAGVECLAAITRATAPCPAGQPFHDACHAALAPALRVGDRCEELDDLCIEGTLCYPDVCATVLHEGDPCGPEGACDPSMPYGLVCTEGRCDSIDLGDPCDPAGDRRCPFSLRCVDGRCAPRLPTGEACARPIDCESSDCTDGLCAARPPPPPPPEDPCEWTGDGDGCGPDRYCVEHRCRPADGAAGNPCRVHGWDDDTLCGAGLRCLAIDGVEVPGWPGLCVAAASPGEVCSADAPCARGLHCIDARCSTVAPPEAGCADIRRCVATHMCVDGECVPRPPLGAPCLAGDCLEGTCLDGTCCALIGGARCSPADAPLDPCASTCNATSGRCLSDVPPEVCGGSCPIGQGCTYRRHCGPLCGVPWET